MTSAEYAAVTTLHVSAATALYMDLNTMLVEFALEMEALVSILAKERTAKSAMEEASFVDGARLHPSVCLSQLRLVPRLSKLRTALFLLL